MPRPKMGLFLEDGTILRPVKAQSLLSSCARPGRGEAPPPHTHRSKSGLQIFQHFLRVSLGFHIFKYVSDTAIRPNYERSSGDPLHFLSVHVFLFDHTEGLAHFLIGVGQQGIREIVLILKLFLALRRIG